MRTPIVLFGVMHILCLNLAQCSIESNLKHYDIIHSSDLSHTIVKRGAQPSSNPYNTIKEIAFNTLGTDFRLILHPHKGVLHSNFQAYTVNANGEEKTVHIDHDNFFYGRVFGESKSEARVHLEDGVMTATIHLPDETFHIEPSWRHLPLSNNLSMIAYKLSDVILSWEHSGQNAKTCGYVKEGAELESDILKDDDNGKLFWNNPDTPQTADLRSKRQVDQYEYTPTKTRCPLLLVADYRFFQEMGASNTKTTINYLISLIDRVHKIYNDTIWQDRQEQAFKGMGFVIKKIVVHSEPTRVKGGEAHYNMIREKWDVRNLLEVFSRSSDNGNHCLSHLFTHQTFRSEGTSVLGLAYIASPRLRSLGGICAHGAVIIFLLFWLWV